jgi:hypothetical protein
MNGIDTEWLFRAGGQKGRDWLEAMSLSNDEWGITDIYSLTDPKGDAAWFNSLDHGEHEIRRLFRRSAFPARVD